MPALIEGKDYEIDPTTGFLIFTAEYLKRRGYCCESGCRNCPWGYKKGGSPSASAPNSKLKLKLGKD